MPILSYLVAIYQLELGGKKELIGYLRQAAPGTTPWTSLFPCTPQFFTKQGKDHLIYSLRGLRLVDTTSGGKRLLWGITPKSSGHFSVEVVAFNFNKNVAGNPKRVERYDLQYQESHQPEDADKAFLTFKKIPHNTCAKRKAP